MQAMMQPDLMFENTQSDIWRILELDGVVKAAPIAMGLQVGAGQWMEAEEGRGAAQVGG